MTNPDPLNDGENVSPEIQGMVSRDFKKLLYNYSPNPSENRLAKVIALLEAERLKLFETEDDVSVCLDPKKERKIRKIIDIARSIL